MTSYSLSHLADRTLEHGLATLDHQHRATLAGLLAHLAEFDARRLYLPAAAPSMFLYCVKQLRWCEQAAFKRIRAARTARRFPCIFPALAGGELHLSAVVLLAPHLTPENADNLLAAAAHKSKAEIEQLLAERFPRSEILALVEAVSEATPAEAPLQLSPGTVEPHARGRVDVQIEAVRPKPVEVLARIDRSNPPPKVKAIAPRRYALHLTMSQEQFDKLRYAQELLSHQVAPGDIVEALERVLDTAIPHLEKVKFAATGRPRQPAPQASSRAPRHVPAHVKRAVWQRDGGRCTFVSETGHRCPARTLLEFDHIDEVACGGRATVERIRLRCRAHNQYGADARSGSSS